MAKPHFRSLAHSSRRSKKLSRQPKREYFQESIGSIPGTLNIHPESSPPEIAVLDYSTNQCERLICLNPREIQPYLERESVTWIDVKGLGHEETLRQIGEVFQRLEMRCGCICVIAMTMRCK
jgi:hypothetical protein